MQAPHEAVARDLGDDRRGRDGGARAVAADDRAVLALERNAEAVGQEQRARRRVEPAQRAGQRREIGAVHASAIDLAAPARRSRSRAWRRRAPRRRAPRAARACASSSRRAARAARTRGPAGGGSRRARPPPTSGPASAPRPGLVRARDERHAERAVVAQQAVTGPEELARRALADGDGHAGERSATIPGREDAARSRHTTRAERLRRSGCATAARPARTRARAAGCAAPAPRCASPAESLRLSPITK